MWSVRQRAERFDVSDGVAFVWTVARDDGEQRSIRVEVSGSALASDGLPSPIAEAVASEGATAVSGFLDWRQPPEVMVISTVEMHPLPRRRTLPFSDR